MTPKILIADDAGFIREILYSYCLQKGFNVVGEVATGSMVIQYALKLKPDIILMDLVLPEINGADASQSILEQLPKTYIIAMSSADEELIFDRSVLAGCRTFLKKPFTKKDLDQIFDSYFKQFQGEKYA